MRRLLTIILLIVFPILLQHEGLAGVTDSNSIRDHLKKRVEFNKTQNKFSCRGELICGVSLIPKFYRRRSFSPAWSGDQGVLPQARSLIEEINKADQEGLRPDDYHQANIVSLLKMIEKKQAQGETVDPKTWVDLDLLLTDAFMLYSSHLFAGRVNPETIHSNWVVANPNADLINILQSALDSNQIVNALRDLQPIHEGYIGLKQFLRKYRNIANKEDWSPMLPGTNLRKGDQGALIQRLRDRLVFLGDLEDSNEEPTGLFDETTELAVIKCQPRHGLKPDGIVGPRTLDILNT